MYFYCVQQIYQNGIALVDPDSQARIKKFYRRPDACRELPLAHALRPTPTSPFEGCLIGRLLPRMLLKDRGIPRSAMAFATTPAGKPYTASPPVSVASR